MMIMDDDKSNRDPEQRQQKRGGSIRLSWSCRRGALRNQSFNHPRVIWFSNLLFRQQQIINSGNGDNNSFQDGIEGQSINKNYDLVGETHSRKIGPRIGLQECKHCTVIPIHWTFVIWAWVADHSSRTSSSSSFSNSSFPIEEHCFSFRIRKWHHPPPWEKDAACITMAITLLLSSWFSLVSIDTTTDNLISFLSCSFLPYPLAVSKQTFSQPERVFKCVFEPDLIV